MEHMIQQIRYICREGCNKDFKTDKYRKVHERIHTGIKIF